MTPIANINSIDEPAPANFPRELLSLCMIVKDESRCLRRCLESVHDWVGELIIVDTGSTDDTVAIARSFGATVLAITWPDDFAIARNVSLDAAHNPWALILDADEVLQVQDAGAFGAALTNNDALAFSLPCASRYDDGSVATAALLRLFRRDQPDMRYRGQLHEQLSAVTSGQVTPTPLGALQIQHDGYQAAVVEAKDKRTRNRHLARAFARTNPDSPHAWYALGVALPESQERIDALQTAASLLKSRSDYALDLFVELARALHAAGNPTGALDAITRGLTLFEASADLLHLQGKILLDTAQFEQAADAFQRCLRLEPEPGQVVLDPGSHSYTALCDLGIALSRLGQSEAAVMRWQEALAIAPAPYTRPLELLGQHHMQQGQWQDARAFFQRAWTVQPQRADLALAFGWCEAKVDNQAAAIPILQPFGDVPQIQALLGRCHLETGHADEALASLATSTLPSVDLLRGWAYWVQSQPRKAAQAWEAWLKAGAADWGSKDSLSRMLFLLEGGRPPQNEPERIAEPIAEMANWFRILLRHQRFGDIEAVIQRAPKLGVRMWRELRRAWAKVLIHDGFTDLGEELLQAARDEQPGFAEDAFDLAQIALEQRDMPRAITLLRECLTHNPTHLAARETLTSLLNLGFR